MDWRIKAAIQGVLSRLPGGQWVNDRLQTIAGGRRNPGEHVSSTFRADWLVHISVLREQGFRVQGATLLEIGTGWLPVFPLCYALAGAARCYTLDIRRHLKAVGVRVAVRALEPHLEELAAAVDEPLAEVRRRWTALHAQENGLRALEAAGIVYQAPADASATGLAPGSIDLSFSNSVLEHVSPLALASLLRESIRVLGSGGLSLHSVNCGDHYAYFDPRISQIHYIRFTERQWRWLNNDLLYQNRLRAAAFVQAAREAGGEVVVDLQRPRAEFLAALPATPIAPEFRHHPPEQLCCTSVTFAVRPRAAPRASST